MTSENFCYWLNGFTEITNRKLPTSGEWQIINDHLDLVFNKVTPNRAEPIPISGRPTLIGVGSISIWPSGNTIAYC